MKKATRKGTDGDTMRAEYDFAGGTRGKHHRAMQAGYTVTIHRSDGATEVKESSHETKSDFAKHDV